MADKKDAPKTDKPAAAKAKKSGKLGTIAMTIIFVVMAPFILPTIVLFIVGMLPTMVAMITDSDRQKSTAIAIGSLNFAGVVPFIIDLWIKGQTISNVMTILTDPTSWLVMLGAAGIGQMVVFAIPPLLTALTMARLETRHKLLKQHLESLRNTWGGEVSTQTPISKLVNKE